MTDATLAPNPKTTADPESPSAPDAKAGKPEVESADSGSTLAPDSKAGEPTGSGSTLVPDSKDTNRPSSPPPSDPTEDPESTAKPLLTTIDPTTVLRHSDVRSGPWSEDEEEDDSYRDPKGNSIYFVQRPFNRAGSEYVLVLWGDFEGYEINGALLEEQPGAWRLEWMKAPLVEDDIGTLYSSEALKMPVLPLGGDRIAVLHLPQIQGCGAAPCRPEDDFMQTTLFEVTDHGLSPLWVLPNGPRCELAGTKPEPVWVTKGYTCRVG